MLFLPFAAPLTEARLLRRRDRFLADVMLDGKEEVAYCVNPGRMEAFSRPDASIWLSPMAGKGRLRWTWELIEVDGVLCGTNTQRPNMIVGELLRRRMLPGLDDWVEMKSEKTLAHPKAEKEAKPGRRAPTSRLDFWLRGPEGDHYIEAKNCHMVYPDGNGYFPDSVSARASRHVAELAALASQGTKCTVIFVVQRGDLLGKVRPSEYHDPTFAAACRAAALAGVRFRGLLVSCSLTGLEVLREVEVDLE
ncbi:unnamed protein product, partial [Effrenium voratum]